MEKPVPWKFYGRTKEINQLQSLMLTKRFNSIAVLGGRGVGKTRLLERVAKTVEAKPGGPPVIFVEIPVASTVDRDEILINKTVKDLLSIATAKGLPPMPRITAPWPDEPAVPLILFRETLRHLINHGAIVMLDEFHNGSLLGLVSEVKLVIDKFRNAENRPPGQLLITGSHQQNILAMLRSDAPLYQRFYNKIYLRPLPVRDLLEMADDHGWLEYPKRYLTLWTAFGGIPRNWEQFADPNNAVGNFEQWREDDAWRTAFVDHEFSRVSEDDEERFDNKAFVELKDLPRELLVWMAVHRPNGEEETKIRQSIFGSIPRPGDFDEWKENTKANREWNWALHVLYKHLNMIEPYKPYGDRPKPRSWRIRDNTTLFQLAVLGLSRAERDYGEESEEHLELPLALEKLKQIEGFAFERLVAGWFRGFENVIRCTHGAYGEGLPDIDILAMLGSDRVSKTVVFGGCKRSSRRHQLWKTHKDIENFKEMAAKSRGLPSDERRFLFSPEFNAGEREKLKTEGFETADIRYMADHTAASPFPEPAPEPKPASPLQERAPEPKTTSPLPEQAPEPKPASPLPERAPERTPDEPASSIDPFDLTPYI